MLLPRMDSESSDWGERFRTVILMFFKCVFIAGSTAASNTRNRRDWLACSSKMPSSSFVSRRLTSDCSVDLRAVLELDSDALIVELHPGVHVRSFLISFLALPSSLLLMPSFLHSRISTPTTYKNLQHRGRRMRSLAWVSWRLCTGVARTPLG